eukprot:1160006-Pelagomonas_calceolata.AAC.17
MEQPKALICSWGALARTSKGRRAAESFDDEDDDGDQGRGQRSKRLDALSREGKLDDVLSARQVWPEDGWLMTCRSELLLKHMQARCGLRGTWYLTTLFDARTRAHTHNTHTHTHAHTHTCTFAARGALIIKLSCLPLPVEALLGGEGAAGAGSLLGGQAQAEEEEDWGLEEITDRRSQVRYGVERMLALPVGIVGLYIKLHARTAHMCTGNNLHCAALVIPQSKPLHFQLGCLGTKRCRLMSAVARCAAQILSVMLGVAHTLAHPIVHARI